MGKACWWIKAKVLRNLQIQHTRSYQILWSIKRIWAPPGCGVVLEGIAELTGECSARIFLVRRKPSSCSKRRMNGWKILTRPSLQSHYGAFLTNNTPFNTDLESTDLCVRSTSLIGLGSGSGNAYFPMRPTRDEQN